MIEKLIKSSVADIWNGDSKKVKKKTKTLPYYLAFFIRVT